MVDLLESLFEFGSRPFVELRERYWLDALTRAADEGVEGVLFTLAFDKTLSPAFPGRLDEALRDRKVSVLFVELACAPKVLESRIVSPERTRYGKLISIDRYRELESTGSFIRLSLPAGTASIDTTNLSVEATAEKIYQLIS